MASTVSVKKHFKFSISGQPSDAVEQLAEPAHAAAVPNQIPLLKPRLLVSKGEEIKAGAPIIEDKQNQDIKLASPAGGAVAEVRYGPRRVIEAVVIQIAAPEPYESFSPIGEKELSRIRRQELITELLARCLWPYIRSIPFKGIASPDENPAAIWVPLDVTDPFHPRSHVYLAEESAKKRFLYGIQILRKLCQRVFVCEHKDHPPADKRLQAVVTHRAAGPHPAGDPGLMHYKNKQSAEENRAWYINGQDLLLLAEGLASGKYPTTRITAVSGGAPENRRHVRTRIGAPAASLARGSLQNGNMRWLAGGLFGGYNATPDGFMGLYENALMLLPEVTEKELLGFARPGPKKPTSSRTFLSAITRPSLPLDADRHGELRACVNCGYCAAVCPVDIFPQYTYKCLYAGEIEEALAHGLLDCVECGLCSYVCPSKLELMDTFQYTKRQYCLGKI